MPPSLPGLRLDESGARIVVIARLRLVFIDVPYAWRAVVERMIEWSKRMAAPPSGQPFHRDGAVRTVPVHAGFLPRPQVRLLVDAIIGDRIWPAPGFGVAAPENAAAAARIERDDESIFLLPHEHVAAPPRTTEVPTAHPFQRQRHLRPRRHVIPRRITLPPG